MATAMAFSTTTKLALIFCIFSLGVGGSPSHALFLTPEMDYCSAVIMNLTDCWSYVSNASSNISKPEGTCCSGLSSALETSWSCLCVAFRSSAEYGVIFNVTKAIALPAACRLSAPSLTNCARNVDPSFLTPSPSIDEGLGRVPGFDPPQWSGCANLTITLAALVATMAIAFGLLLGPPAQ